MDERAERLAQIREHLPSGPLTWAVRDTADLKWLLSEVERLERERDEALAANRLLSGLRSAVAHLVANCGHCGGTGRWEGRVGQMTDPECPVCTPTRKMLNLTGRAALAGTDAPPQKGE